MRSQQTWPVRLLCAVLSLFTVVALGACMTWGKDPHTEPSALSTSITPTTNVPQKPQVPNEDTAFHRVAYIPIDNRPVNRERVAYLAESIGVELLMPCEELYRTALDNMEPNADGSTTGNREALLQWLLETDKVCDHFIISLDQMTSGGLVSSRWLSNTDLNLEYAMVDAILTLSQNNTVYVFDTVMRLASTVDYQGYGLQEYNAFRAYGRVERKLLEKEELTIENIAAGYAYDQNDNRIAIDVSKEAVTSYHASRERKLRIIDYLLRSQKGKIDFLYIGVDDSSPQNTVQTNEIHYIQSLMGSRGTLSAATDELGLCCLARMASDFYGAAKVNLTYFGPGKDQPADGYDIGTLDENARMHLSALSVLPTEADREALQVLFLTYGSKNVHREELLQQLKANQSGQIPTAVIDVSEAPEILAELLIGDEEIDLCRLLGYSSWNTAANAMGIALSQSVARYAYLHSVETSSTQADAGFLKSMTFAYIKDISYKCFSNSLEDLVGSTSVCSAQKVIARINDGSVITSLKDYKVLSCCEVEVSDFRYPWNRTFEMTFCINIREKEGK